MIQFIGVTKTYPAKPKPITALDEVSFEINPGEFVFLVGHSGSGKTTILRQIIREETPSKGRIFFNDDDITRLKRNGVYKLRRQIGTIFQDYKLVEDKTAYENVAFALEAAGANGKQVRETVPYVLDIVNLADRAESFPAELSGGEKQRVAIARAIVNNPKLLIADEPTGNLDPDSAWDVVQVLDKINKWGTTIIMSTHGTDIVDSLRKRVIKLEKGKLVRDDKSGAYEQADEYELKILGEEAGERKKKKQVKEEKEKGKEKDKDKEEKEVVTDKLDKKLDEKLTEASTTGLNELKLGKNLQKKLSEKYKDVEDILSAGVAKVNEDLNQNEVRELARAIKKFVTTE